MGKVKSYRVACYETIQAYIYIDATSEDEAIEKFSEMYDIPLKHLTAREEGIVNEED